MDLLYRRYRRRDSGVWCLVLEHVMAEHFDVPPHIEFTPEDVRYEVTATVERISDQA